MRWCFATTLGAVDEESETGEHSSSPDPQAEPEVAAESDVVAPLPRGRLGGLSDLLSGRGARSGASSSGPATAREIVNGLDERERRLSAAGVVLAIGLVVAGYLTNRHSPVLKVRTASSTLLIAGVIIIVIMIFGVIFRRRALVGFSSFMVGFELITAGNVLGVAFLGFGGWLLVRALRRQRQDQATRRPMPDRKAAPSVPTGPPKASKRYTPPRRSRVAARRR